MDFSISQISTSTQYPKEAGSERVRIPDVYVFQAHPYDTAEAGAYNLYAMNQLVTNAGVDPISRQFGIKDSAAGRAGKTALINLPLALFSTITEHEIFGHGARYREFGYDATYVINGSNNSTSPIGDERISLDEKILAAIGGTEATQVMANVIGLNMFARGGRYYDVLPYMLARLDVSKYILAGKDPSSFGNPYDGDETLNDVENYWNYMTLKRGRDLIGRYGLETVAREGLWDGPGFSYDAIKLGAAWNLVDPTMWYCAFQLGKYVARGNEEFKVPNFLPRTGFVLSPLGPEYYLSVPFRYNSVVFDPSVRVAVNDEGNSYGGGLGISNIRISDRVTMSPGAQVWQQDGKTGFMVEDVTYAKITNGFELGLGASYKSEGYVMGRPLDEGFQLTGRMKVQF